MDILDVFVGVGDLLTLVSRWRFTVCLAGGLAALAILNCGTEPGAVLGYLLCAGLIVTGIVWEWRFRRDEA